MPILHVQFKGVRQQLQIEVGVVEEDGENLTLKAKDGSKMGVIVKSEIAGWWVGEEAGFAD